jgi:RNA polymerase I-specific transcription initiation factor RRN7
MAQTPNPPNYTPTLDPSTSRLIGAEGLEEEKTNDDDKGDSSSDSDEGDQTEKEEGVDPDILAELSDLSDDSEMNEVENAEISGSGPKWRRRRRLRVSDTLVTLILGLWTLRVPVMGFDIES